MVGFELTVNKTVCVVAQPSVFVPTTEYVVVVAGVTETEEPVNAPGFHVYEVAPLAVNVEVLPGQITVGDTEAIIVGVAMMVIAMVPVEVHPAALAPVTV
jgi:hypothetical protein